MYSSTFRQRKNFFFYFFPHSYKSRSVEPKIQLKKKKKERKKIILSKKKQNVKLLQLLLVSLVTILKTSK